MKEEKNINLKNQLAPKTYEEYGTEVLSRWQYLEYAKEEQEISI